MAERSAVPLPSMAGRPSLQHILRNVPPEKLDQPCRDDHLSEIALSIAEWHSIAPFLLLTVADEIMIQRNNPDWITQKIGMLRVWKEKFGRKATYRKLGKVFWKLERTDLVEELCELLQPETESNSSSGDEDSPLATKISERSTEGLYGKHIRRGHETEQSLHDEALESFEPTITMDLTSSHAKKNIEKSCGESETRKIGKFKKLRKKLFGKKKSRCSYYVNYLRGRYSRELPAFFTHQWPPPPTHKVFNLAMIEHQTIQRGPIDEELVRLTLRGNVDDIMRRKSPIEVKNLFKLDTRKRKVILIEGAPGAGKSTLAWQIVQKWGSGKLFQEFKIVVFVQLRDIAIQSATSLADILPAESEVMRSEIMSKLWSRRGRGVLFVLDGWDEYSPGLQAHSIFQQLICNPERVNLHLSSLIITSRPIASGELQRYTSARVEIVGFTSAEVKNYFTESIGDSQTEQKFQDQLRECPVIEASCYLPLNAAIIVHLYLSLNHTLPHTLHEVFLSLVLCCIIRHLTRETESGKKVPSISSLDYLPPDLQEPFDNICAMAYHGVMMNKTTFSATDLRSFNLPTELSTLSLTQGIQSFTAFEQSLSYNFLHLSVQELLAALYISKLSAAEQIQIFNDLFDQRRLAAVFRFYAAFTKLETEGMRDIVSRIIWRQEKPLLVNLLHGLYEAQDLSLCQFVASHLKGELDLSANTLNPMDCLVVGYFLSCVCLTTSREFEANLCGCSLDDYRASFLVRGLSSNLADAQTTTGDGAPGHLAMDLRKNHKFSGHGFGSLLQVMNVITTMDLSRDNRMFAMKVNCFPHLNLSGNQLGDDDIAHVSESLKISTTLKRMSAAFCNISQKGGKAIGDVLIVNRSLQVLDLHENPISVGIVHIAESLKQNCSLLQLNLGNCGISEEGCKAIGDALMVNRSLQVLDLRDNLISAGVVHIAESLKHNPSLLEISFGGFGISVDNVKTLCDALIVDRRSLQVLDLHKNSMEVKGGKAIGDALMVNVLSVRMLDLDYNPISTAVVHMAESLRHNHSLQEINFGGCGISEKEAESLAISLKENNSLQTLILKNSDLSDVGAAHIADSLRHNYCLKKLDISDCCGLGDQGLKSLASALEVNSSLEDLNFGQNYAITGVGLMALGESLKRNRGLKTLTLTGISNVTSVFVRCLQENDHLLQLEILLLFQLEAVEQEIKAVNSIRRRKNLPQLEFYDVKV